MTTFVLVHGAWHGPWAWDRVVPVLTAAGARTLTPDLQGGDHGLHDHAEAVVAAIDTVHDDCVLVGHSYAGLVVREAADARPGNVGHIVLVDGWAGGDGAGLFDLAPDFFVEAMRKWAEANGDGRSIPPPSPDLFGVTDEAEWLAARLVPQPLRAFTETTRLSGAVDRIPGTAVHCEPQVFPFREIGASVGYRTVPIDGPHDVMVADPEGIARLILEAPGLE